jgi:hypothetical protein
MASGSILSIGNAIKNEKSKGSGRRVCQIILSTIYQNGKKITKWPQTIPNGQNIQKTGKLAK